MIGVYFIEAKLSQLVKIGVTTDLYTRMKALSGANADTIKLFGFIPTKDLINAKQIEAAYHDQYKSFNHHGEWFSLNSEEIKLVKDNFPVNCTFSPPKNPMLKENIPYKPQKGSAINSIYCFIRSNAPTSISSICSGFGLYPSVVKQHIRELNKRGLIFYDQTTEQILI